MFLCRSCHLTPCRCIAADRLTRTATSCGSPQRINTDLSWFTLSYKSTFVLEGYPHIMAPRTKLVAIHPIHGYAIKPQQDLKTIKRNERERNRVETVNRGFETLRMHVPSTASVKKMSKVNILNQAVDYIMYLQHVLDQTSDATPESPWSHLPNYYHQQYSHQQNLYQHQMMNSQSTPVTPSTFNDSSNHGYYSDSSMQSPAMSRSSSWTSPAMSKAALMTSPENQLYFSHQIKEEAPDVPDSTTDMADSSGDEEDVLDAIAEWQQI